MSGCCCSSLSGAARCCAADTAAGPCGAAGAVHFNLDDTQSGRRLAALTNQLQSRSIYTMGRTVTPGLYAAGQPDEHSMVIISGASRLCFDKLRRSHRATSAWILVLAEVAGRSAASDGSPRELVERIIAVRLDRIVKHRRLVMALPGAGRALANVVVKSTGFEIEAVTASVSRCVRIGLRPEDVCSAALPDRGRCCRG